MTIYLNGVIHTLDPAQPRVEAVACEYGRVVAVGRSYELQALACSPVDIVDLQGRTAIPGLIDAHIHLLSLGLALGWVELGGAATLAECLERVAWRAQETEPGRWIMGRGWNQNEWAEGRWPTSMPSSAIGRSCSTARTGISCG
jgi:predicted amidohydrolase YtcJ